MVRGCVVLCLFAIVVAASCEVVTLNDKNFDSETSSGLWLLKFYAPWCGHCKRLAPVLEELAPAVENIAKIGTINCDDETQLCRRFSVRGYPTLYIKRGDMLRQHNGGRSKEDLENVLQAFSGPAIATLSTNDLKKSIEDPAGVVFLSLSAASDTPDFFSKVAEENQGVSRFAVPEDLTQVMSTLGLQSGSVIVVKDSRFFTFEGPKTKAAFSDFAKRHRFPFLPEITRSNYQDVVYDQKLTALAVFDPELDTDNKFRNTMTEMSRELGDRMGFAWISLPQWKKYLEQFSLGDSSSTPAIVVLAEGGEDGYFLLSSASVPLDFAEVPRFLQRILDGKQEKLGTTFMQSINRTLTKVAEPLTEVLADHPYVVFGVFFSLCLAMILALIFCDVPAPPSPEEIAEHHRHLQQQQQQPEPSQVDHLKAE